MTNPNDTRSSAPTTNSGEVEVSTTDTSQSEAPAMAQFEDVDDSTLRTLYQNEGKNAESYSLHVTEAVDAAGIDREATVDVDILADESPPVLAVIEIPDEEQTVARFGRTLGYDGSSSRVRIPPTLLRRDRPQGLGLDLDEYDKDNPLLFEPIPMEGVVFLEPVRYADGTSFTQDGEDDEDDARTIQNEHAEQHSVPIDVVNQTAQVTGVTRDAIHTALAVVEEFEIEPDSQPVDDVVEVGDETDAIIYILEEGRTVADFLDVEPDAVTEAVEQLFQDLATDLAAEVRDRDLARRVKKRAVLVETITDTDREGDS